MHESEAPGRPDDAHDLQTVATLLERAGLRLPADQIAGLVAGYRADRAKAAALRATLAEGDEPAHVFVAADAGRAGA